MQSFFKSTKEKEIQQKKPERKDTLIYFSSVDLLFSEDEGFWRALKSFIEKTKGSVTYFQLAKLINSSVPIIFSAESIEANSGLNPEKENIDSEAQQKCIEVSLEEMCRKDIVTIMRLISLDKGYYLSQGSVFPFSIVSTTFFQKTLSLSRTTAILTANAF